MTCTTLISQSTGTATLEEWAKLDLNAPISRVLRLTRVQLDDTHDPLGVEEVVLALERFPGLAPDAEADDPRIFRTATASKEPLCVVHEPPHGLHAQSGLGAHDCARHLVAGEKIEGRKPCVSGEGKRCLPG